MSPTFNSKIRFLFLKVVSLFKMTKKKIVITGSQGFIATNLILELSKNDNFEMYGIDSEIAKSVNKEFSKEFITHNVFDLIDIEKTCQVIAGADIIVHLAAKGNVVESIENPIENLNANVLSTINLLEAMRLTNVKNIVFSSTGGALMGNTLPPVNEESLPSPISPYGASKLACEGYLSAFSNAYSINAIALRFGNVYGKYSSHKIGVINKWIRAALNQDRINIYGDGSSTRDYIHVDDLCNGIKGAIDRLLKNRTRNFEKYHLANNREISLLEICDILERYTSKKLEKVFFDQRQGEVVRNCSDYSLAKEILSFEPKKDFFDGIVDLYKWIEKTEFNLIEN